jgi:cell division protein FtsZ
MSINIGPAASDELAPKITVIGIGGAGGNAIANMIASEIEGVEFVVANTDAQALSSSPAEKRIQLGPDITNGLGAGAKPEVGKAAAEETVAEIEEALQGVNMVFIAAGMGGGTGTGAAPVIAEVARRMGVLTVGVVTKPFLFEGTRRMRAAEAGIRDLQQNVDTLIVIPNQNLFLIASPDTTFKEAFQMADEVLQQGVRSITDLMVMPGLINLDFADVRSVMSEMGKAMMGTGEAEGEDRARQAAEQAIANPLLDGVSMQGAKGVIISIIGGEDMKLFEVDGAANHIRNLVDEDANIIWGSAFNPDLDGKIRVSVVATGIEQEGETTMPAARSSARPVALPQSRAPQRPVLDLAGEAEAPEETPAADTGPAPEPEKPAAPRITLTPPEPVAYEPDPEAHVVAEDLFEEPDLDEESGSHEADVDGDEDTGHSPLIRSKPLFADPVAEAQDAREDGEDDDEAPSARPFNLSGMQSGEDMGEPEDEDVDEIVDPLAGLRGAEEEPFDLAGTEAPDDEEDTVAPSAQPRADRAPVKGSGATASAAGGSTLFERMANLSRSSVSDDDDDDDDGGDDDTTALSIPRFLGRQNNQ